MSHQRAEQRSTGGIDTLLLNGSAFANTLDIEGLPADLCNSSDHRSDAKTVDPSELRTPARQRAVLGESDANTAGTNSSGVSDDDGGSTAADAGKACPSRLDNDETSPTGVTLLGSADDAVSGGRCHAAAAGGHYHEEATVLEEFLTHTEVDALLGPALSWTNPFKVGRMPMCFLARSVECSRKKTTPGVILVATPDQLLRWALLQE